jgi:hypothetical protein
MADGQRIMIGPFMTRWMVTTVVKTEQGTMWSISNLVPKYRKESAQATKRMDIFLGLSTFDTAISDVYSSLENIQRVPCIMYCFHALACGSDTTYIDTFIMMSLPTILVKRLTLYGLRSTFVTKIRMKINIGNFTTLLKPNIGTHLKGIETNFQLVPLFLKSFHFWVS